MQNEIKAVPAPKIIKILDEMFTIPSVGYAKRWESLSIEEKIGAVAEKLDEVIERVNKGNHAE